MYIGYIPPGYASQGEEREVYTTRVCLPGWESVVYTTRVCLPGCENSGIYHPGMLPKVRTVVYTTRVCLPGWVSLGCTMPPWVGIPRVYYASLLFPFHCWWTVLAPYYSRFTVGEQFWPLPFPVSLLASSSGLFPFITRFTVGLGMSPLPSPVSLFG